MGVDIVQTFLPSTSFEQSAKWLDNLRLGKQRVECLQILKALSDPDYGWQSHSAVSMWRGYENALIVYGLEVCEEWKSRGYKDTCMNKILNMGVTVDPELIMVIPPWLTEEFASNHRSILLGKVKESYDELAFGLTTATMTRISCQDSKASVKRYSQAVSRFSKAIEVMDWYQQWNWTEEPAKRNEAGKWPYLWPEKED